MKVKKYAVMFGVGLVLSALFTGCGFLFGLIFELPGDWDMAYKWPGKSTGYAIVSFIQMAYLKTITAMTVIGHKMVWTCALLTQDL